MDPTKPVPASQKPAPTAGDSLAARHGVQALSKMTPREHIIFQKSCICLAENITAWGQTALDCLRIVDEQVRSLHSQNEDLDDDDIEAWETKFRKLREENNRQKRDIKLHQDYVLFANPRLEKAAAKEKAHEELKEKVISLERELEKEKAERKVNEGTKEELEKMKNQWAAVASIVEL